MSNLCENDYFNLYMTQLFQTLGQLSAALLTSTLAIPVYSYYSRYMRNNTSYEYDNNFDNNFKSTAVCESGDVSGESITTEMEMDIDEDSITDADK